jgi:hypothetical protein
MDEWLIGRAAIQRAEATEGVVAIAAGPGNRREHLASAK